MAQSQQPTLPQFSPQASPSPNTTSNSFAFSQQKRQKLSPSGPSQPGSPYANSPYATSPPPTTPGPLTPTLSMPAPPATQASNAQFSQNSYTSYQQNGHGRSTSTGMALSMPPATPAATLPSPQPPTPGALSTPAPYTPATLAPMAPSSTNPPPANTMGPPTINPTKAQPSKTASYDVDDMLVGTGIDLDEEMEYLNQDLGGSFQPGSKDSFYGAGPANQPAQATEAKTHEELAAESADLAWNQAARRLAVTRSHEIKQNTLEPGRVHKQMNDIAQKYGLGLNLDLKPDNKQYMGKFNNPVDFPKPELKVVTRPGDNGAFVHTTGSFIPQDAYLVDQIAILSIGTKEHLRDLLREAGEVATIRQQTSHGVVPPEWADAAAVQPSGTVNGESAGARTGAESATSPRTNARKRSAGEMSNGLPTPVSDAPSPNYMVDSMLSGGKFAQNAEEGRLKKRQKRVDKLLEKDRDGADDGSRAGSVAPGTPGSVAPEQGDAKAPSKKESKKAAKAAEASSTTVNSTLSFFTGSKKKKYSWMTGDAGNSGASTPRAPAASGLGASGGAGRSRTARGPLTKAGVAHLGQFREDSEKGKHIQLRDWATVLEARGYKKLLQDALGKMDKSLTGDRVSAENSESRADKAT
ncbi:hypothetical protein F4780DRAFT_771851 [Xylariomycetidae sp. FL0641]|nr:hypothetical protein F4780DRAFT_771851 [Xylariomycetidae sp. FL0641]